MNHILIVGRSFSSLTNYLDEHNCRYTYLKDIRITKSPDKYSGERVVVDFSDKKNIVEALTKVKKPIDGVMVVYENYILATAWIAKYLGLPGLPVNSAVACTDKNIMRQKFATAPIQISPDFKLIDNERDILDFSSKHFFPLIVKPTNLSKSLLVTKSNDIKELQENYRKSVSLLADAYKKYAPNRVPKLLIEEFLEGSIHSVDAFVDKDGTPMVLEQVVDYQTGYDIGYDDNFHYSRILPSKLSPDDQKSLRECAAMGIKALGMKSSPAHVEIIMTANGPRLVEIGARNGGYRERMHLIANGIDLIGAALDIAFGNKPSIKATRNDSIAVLELFPKTGGYFKKLNNESRLRKLQSINYVSIKAHPGDRIGKSSEGYKATAIIILHNPNKKQFEKDLAYVNKYVSVTIQ